MRLFMLSTIGTSTVTNALEPAVRGRVLGLGNATETELTEDDRSFLNDALARTRATLAEADRNQAKALSAELNGWLTYEDEARSSEVAMTNVQHWLLTTDTYVGYCAGEIVKDWLEAHGSHAQLLRVEGLRTDDANSFRAALADVMKDLWDTIEGYKAAGYRIVFNLTGGFKGVNAFFQTVATLAEAEAIYTFERTNQLMHIPRLPVRLDEERLTAMQTGIFARLGAGEEIAEDEARKLGGSDALLYFVDGRAILSEWGRSIWERVWSDRARRELMSVADGRLVLTERFAKEAKGLPPDRLLLVTQALKALSHWIANLPGHWKRHTIDKLTTPHPNGESTHEVYAWSDKNAGRIFFHKEPDGRVVVDELGEHL
jgi:putative CRISPR-associated protein (TIGR02619 family)